MADDSGMRAQRKDPDSLSGAAIPFRFEVTWRSLTAPLHRTGTAVALVSKPARNQPTPIEAKEWEMVLPRMRRPASLAAMPMAAPNFATSPEQSSRRWMYGAAGVVALVLAFAAIRPSGKESSPEAQVKSADMEPAGWLTEWASDATGSARGRQISLCRPSLGMANYRLEFLGRIERRSLGWVFRAADSRDYYAGKLEATPSGLAVTHFAVVQGVEGPHIQRPIPFSVGFGAAIKVRLDAIGPRYTVSIQNQVVEEWEDGRLKTGGVGFLNEREEQGEVSAVQISFPKVARK